MTQVKKPAFSDIAKVVAKKSTATKFKSSAPPPPKKKTSMNRPISPKPTTKPTAKKRTADKASTDVEFEYPLI